MKVKLLILDFDGVIVDSAYECWVRCADVTTVDETLDDVQTDDEAAKGLFLKYRYLVGPAHEFYYLMRAIQECGDETVSQCFYEYASENDNTLAYRFKDNFFKSRQRHKKKDMAGWIGSNKGYRSVIDLAVRFSDRSRLFIATMKDEQSVLDILKFNGINCKSTHILGDSLGSNKYEHLSKIISRHQEIEANDIMFIDDNYKHLREVAELGVDMKLATWGYGTAESHKEALINGVSLMNLDDCEEIVPNE